jgi:hypothetical protein
VGDIDFKNEGLKRAHVPIKNRKKEGKKKVTF